MAVLLGLMARLAQVAKAVVVVVLALPVEEALAVAVPGDFPVVAGVVVVPLTALTRVLAALAATVFAASTLGKGLT
jgi:hypothetical protein